MGMRMGVATLAGVALMLGGCGADGGGDAADNQSAAMARIDLTITAAGGAHRFSVEQARTADQQKRGLMYRTDIGEDQGMLFYPYPPDGGPPRVATFWMKDTPTPLDIVFIRQDGTIARIAENTAPYSQDSIPSGEPIAAVLELLGGRTAQLGISPGDKVDWPGRKGAR